MEKYLKVGVVTTTHGLKGEVKVYPTTDDAGRFDDLTELFAVKNNKKTPLQIEHVKYFKQLVICKFQGIDSIEEVSPLVKAELYIDRKFGVELAEDEYYIADLIDMAVETEEGPFGTIKDVIQTGANDVYVIDTKRYGEVLVPAIKQCIKLVDTENNKMLVELLPGLLPEES